MVIERELILKEEYAGYPVGTTIYQLANCKLLLGYKESKPVFCNLGDVKVSEVPYTINNAFIKINRLKGKIAFYNNRTDIVFYSISENKFAYCFKEYPNIFIKDMLLNIGQVQTRNILTYIIESMLSGPFLVQDVQDFITTIFEEHSTYTFPAIIDDEFNVTFPDFPNTLTYGETFEHAKLMAKEALKLTLFDMDFVLLPSQIDDAELITVKLG